MKNKFGKVGVLFGGRSAERAVSLMSGKGVLEALLSKGLDAHPFDPEQRSLAELAAEKFDRVFIVLHGRYGEDGTMQGALEQLGIPYTGSGVMAASIAMDKIMSKRLWLAHSLPVPNFSILEAHNFQKDALYALPEKLGFPLMLKPAHEGSTIGIRKITQASELEAGFEVSKQYDNVILAEEFINGRELTIAVLGNQHDAKALPVIEIRVPTGSYDYEHKYFSDDTQYLCPAPIDNALTEQVQKLAVQAYKIIGCRGWARLDMMLRASDNQPFLLEINAVPGMTGHSLVPMAAKAIGLSYADLCVEILEMATLDWSQKTQWKTA